MAEFAPTFPLTITFDNIKREIVEEVFKYVTGSNQYAYLTLAECIKDPKEIQRFVDNYDNIGSIIIESRYSGSDNCNFKILPLTTYDYDYSRKHKTYEVVEFAAEGIVDDETVRYSKCIKLSVEAVILKGTLDKEHMLKECVVGLYISYL